jgi:Camelysin metallo-endopeptidase
MTRLKVLVNRPRRTLAALATVLVAVGITAASGASFTASSASPGNVFAAGTLSIASSKDNAAIMNIGGMRPGDPASTGLVDIQNTGSLSGAFTLTRASLTDSDTANPLSGKLNVVIGDCGLWTGGVAPSCSTPTQKYSGTLANLTNPVTLGTFLGSEKHRYQVTVSLDSTAGNAYQGDSSTTELDFNAA